MVIDKVKPYWAEEEAQRYKEIRAEQEKLFEPTPPAPDSIEKWRALDQEAKELRRTAEARYISDHDDEEIIEDCKEIVSAITREDFLQDLNAQRKLFENAPKDDDVETLLADNVDNFYWFVLKSLRVQLNALNSNESEKIAVRLVNEKTDSFYPDDQTPQNIQESRELPTVTYTNKPGVVLTTDKLMALFFGANAPIAPKGQIPGQLTFIPVKYEKTGAPEVTLYYTFDFDNDLFARLKLEKKIDDEDYFILSFIANYWRAGDNRISVNRLYKDMTGDDPNTKQSTELTNRLMKIAGTNIFINDKEVRRAWGIEDERKTYKEILMPLAPIKVGVERFVTRGQVVEAAVEILAEPDIVKLGYEMGQITTIPKNLLHVKKKNGRALNRTPRFYRVLHFLIRRISAMKNDNLSAKILYDTFYTETGERTNRDKQLARECLYTILDYFKECDGWIKGYREETTPTTGRTGVRIFYEPTPKKISKAKR